MLVDLQYTMLYVSVLGARMRAQSASVRRYKAHMQSRTGRIGTTGAQHSTIDDEAARTPGGVISCSPARNIEGEWRPWGYCTPLDMCCAELDPEDWCKVIRSLAGGVETACMERGFCWG